MTGKTISLDFEGYWLKKNSVPTHSGIYCVYACKYNKSEDNITLGELIYIGESENVRTRLGAHEKQKLWEEYLTAGETLCFSTAKVSSSDRVRAESALISYHKPPANIEYAGEFKDNKTTIAVSGAAKHLERNFTVG